MGEGVEEMRDYRPLFLEAWQLMGRAVNRGNVESRGRFLLSFLFRWERLKHAHMLRGKMKEMGR